MINLLPQDTKHNYLYARRNTSLLRWSALFLISIAGVAVIVAGGLFYINQSVRSLADQNAKDTQSLKDQKIDEVQKEIADISGSLKLTVQVLSKEVLFSKLITKIAAAIPANSALTGLNISKTQGALDLSADAIDYETASQVQVNLADPKNGIFDKADLISIDCSDGGEDSKYPCSVNVRAQFSKNNQFLFIGSSKAKQ